MLKNYRLLILLSFALTLSATLFAQKSSELKYYDASQVAILINKGFDNTPMLYSRLPEDMKSVTREAVWNLGLNSAGLAVRFSSDSKAIGARWTLLNNFSMAHMAGTGIRGIDLYTLEKGEWKFIGTAMPNGKESRNIMVSKMDGRMREYMAYLPLYDGVEKLEIGVDSTAYVGKPTVTQLLPEGTSRLPIVFYGTSITQGGCASRPGMCYSNIISRAFNCEAINLGFSGNARMDKSMVEIVARPKASAYVIDCLPNCTAQIVRDSGYYFMSTLAGKHPEVPIYMVENISFPDRIANTQTDKDLIEKNAEWAALYKRLRKEGYRNLKYIPAKGLTDDDGEGSVDGSHLTDLGFLRMAKALEKYLK